MRSEKLRVVLNAISLSRIPLGLVFLVLILRGALTEGLLVFLLGVSSDKVDGFLARRLRLEKIGLGRVLDPISDRIFISLSFLALCLAELKVDISWWAVLLTVGQDLILAPVGAYATFKKHRVSVSALGKLATSYQYVFVSFLLLLNLLGFSLNLLPLELMLVSLNLLSAGHHIYLWLLKGKNGAS
ncbi:CDP-alcohol phosphatidyltransferase family protein [Pampinifervens florentissimum]|uniref:CDP-alcohol phosphatidyltransferase family protein n=1 Tax=Pampinifervens florentissimum TaxID=1632019 RepID=UPI0013B4963D|nr:CDP-alcohol phosphatidyltransferase family protein [Hydrogenobacter sp. T-8]QID32470.1 CDP-alcohol phosphatidyltransferase family protein [Hydrogenobacter sp. T-8]